jgi:hypothetical protein
MNSKGRPAAASSPEVREVRRHIAEAGDEKILQIVRLMDALNDRGASDALLAPVRPRLAAMNTSHPLRFTRLLFMPADPLIVPRDEWRPGMPGVPRAALPILANFVRGVMSGAHSTPADRGALAQTDGLIAGATTADADIVRAAGLVCWPNVANALRCLGDTLNDDGSARDCAAAWRDSGLPAQTLKPIAAGLAAVLEAAPLLDEYQRTEGAPDLTRLTQTLTQAETPDMQAWGTLFSLLLIRLPEHAGDLLAAPRSSRRQTETAERAAEFALVWATPASRSPQSAITDEEAATLRCRAALLDNLARAPGDPARRRQAGAARAALRDASWGRFTQALETEIVAPVRGLAPCEPASAERVDALESAARRLRLYELNARMLGGGPTQTDIRLKMTAGLRDAPGLSPMDQARLLELMGDIAAARALLDQ